MDLPSDSDESDVDFVPEGEEDVSAESEAEADEETDALFEVELAKKNAKRAAQSSKKIPRKKAKVSDEKEDTVETEIKKSLDPEAEKKHEEDLWASFLGTPKQCNSSSDKNDVAKIESMSKEAKVVEITKPVDTSDEKVESNEKECPVEEVGIETGKTNKPSIKPVESNSKVVARGKMPLPPGLPAARKSGGGLASVLNRIGKKDKLSTLEKSKQDWMSFKKDEGIEEEIQTHNRGKDGYLERQDFLQRTDLRQFEIEKSLRTNKRSNR